VLSGVPRYETITLSESDYASLKVNDYEPILFDTTTGEITLYRFCRYHPVAPSTTVQTVTP
jgi:hypothetical protein